MGNEETDGEGVEQEVRGEDEEKKRGRRGCCAVLDVAYSTAAAAFDRVRTAYFRRIKTNIQQILQKRHYLVMQFMLYDSKGSVTKEHSNPSIIVSKF